MAIQTGTLQNATIYVSLRSKGSSRQIPSGRKINAKNATGRIGSEMVCIYYDSRLISALTETKLYLSKLSSGAAVTPIGVNAFAIPATKIPEVTSFLDAMDARVNSDLEYILDNYNEIKDSELQLIRDSLEGEDAAYIKNVMDRANKRYPTADEMKANRQILVSITASPLANAIPNIELMRERIEDETVARYKEAVFNGLNTIFTDVAAYWIRTCNSLDVNNKSRNSFERNVAALKDANLIRKDKFTKVVLDYIKSSGDMIFESDLQQKLLLLNIYREANRNDMGGCLSSLTKLESKLVKEIGVSGGVIKLDEFDEDAMDCMELEELKGD